MEMPLEGLSVLVVDDDEDARELLAMVLQRHGAVARTAEDVAEAMGLLSSWRPSVIVTDISLTGDADGFALLAKVRAGATTRDIPVIAITGHAEKEFRQRAIEAGFQKFITKPYDLVSLVSAIASAASTTSPPIEPRLDIAALTAWIDHRDLRALLAFVNARSSFRFSSILRFANEELESLWTFDREEPSADRFPPNSPTESSYCRHIAAVPAPFVVEDAESDPRVVDHPKRATLRSYCGVPIHREDGTLFGTLCSYDAAPRAVPAEFIAELERIAALLRRALPTLATAP